MKANKLYIILFFLALLNYSCENELAVDAPKFNINGYTVTKIDEGHGDTIRRVTFDISENANIISFFSGQYGSEFKYKDGKVDNLRTLDFNFETSCGYGEQAPLSQFSVLASPDFSGSIHIDSVQKAQWIDITHLFDFSKLTNQNKNYEPNGIAHLASLLKEHSNLHLAFKYKTPNQFTNGIYAAIRIQNWQLLAESEMFGQSILPVEWSLLEHGNVRAGRNSLSASTITLRGNHGDFNSTNPQVISWLEDETEAWVISKQINYTTDLGRDTPIPVKAFGDPSLNNFTFDYKEAGNYHVVFLANNSTIQGQEKIIKEMIIQVP